MAAENPAPTPSFNRGRPEPPPVPPGTGTIGIVLFLAALSMLFAAAMVAYVIIRLQLETPAVQFNRPVVPAGSLRFPQLFWVSTILVIGVSVALSRALHQLRRERQPGFRMWLNAAIALGTGFLIVQSPAMTLLVREHAQLRGSGLFLYALVFFLVLVHALHVVGGMAVLGRVWFRARQGVYDHEHYQPVRHAAMYWHFLDIVWLVMLLTFLATA